MLELQEIVSIPVCHYFIQLVLCANFRFDPFFGDNAVDSDLPRRSQVMGDTKKELVSQATTRTVTEVLNLGKMCFGNLDISIRLIAFQQLSSALSLASISSLRTLQRDWYLQLAQVDCSSQKSETPLLISGDII